MSHLSLTLTIAVTYVLCSVESTLLDNKIQQTDSDPTPCTCGIFLSGQFKKGSKEQPKGVPVLTQEMDTPFMNNAIGNRQCINKCLELVSITSGVWVNGNGGIVRVLVFVCSCLSSVRDDKTTEKNIREDKITPISYQNCWPDTFVLVVHENSLS